MASFVALVLVPHAARPMQSAMVIKPRMANLVARNEANDSRDALFRGFAYRRQVCYFGDTAKGASMPDNPFEDFGEEFRRAMEAHARIMREQMERARKQMHAAMQQAHEDFERARAEFEEMMAQARRDMAAGWSARDDGKSAPKRRRPPRRPRGGEPAPVKPRPKPKPLVDGAEAPIE